MEAVGVNTPEELQPSSVSGGEGVASGVSVTLSIVIPAYNEERFIGTLLERIRAVDLTPSASTTEIIVVDDGSRDRTVEIASAVPAFAFTGCRSTAARARRCAPALALATGDLLIIQDADLEYDPNDYVPMVQALQAGAATSSTAAGIWAAAGTRTSRWRPISAAAA